MSFDRTELLEKKVDVMQREISEVIAEMQKMTQGLARMVQIALRTLDERVTAIEAKAPGIRNEDEGKEL